MNKKFSFLILEEEWEKEENGDEATTEKNPEMVAEEFQKPKKAIVVRELKPKKEPINVIFCGHVDAGKSTIGGQIMYDKIILFKN